jgi:D-beta-D-heptose 7-phosphate kinase/D-beta-D-heptose 1-phosphate adenosyltransferase
MRPLELSRLESLLRAFQKVRLLVLGDLVLDEYVWGDVERVSPEAPVPVVHVREETVVLGGAANVARNVVALGGTASFCSVVGDDAAGRRAADLLEDLGVDAGGLLVAPGRLTTRKTRVVARSQQVVRFDRETLEPPPAAVGRRLLAVLERQLSSCGGAVLEDYGKGVLTKPVVAGAMRRFRAAGSVVVDRTGWRSLGARCSSPTCAKPKALSGIAIHTRADLVRAVANLRRRIGGGAVVVTKGAEGMSVFDEGMEGVDVPTLAREVFDVQGAGDTSIAALALALRAGATLLEAAVIANAAAGVVVGKVGTATASLDEVRELLPSTLSAAQEAP